MDLYNLEIYSQSTQITYVFSEVETSFNPFGLATKGTCEASKISLKDVNYWVNEYKNNGILNNKRVSIVKLTEVKK